MEKSDLGKLSKLKSGETLDWVQSGNDTLPLALGGWDFFLTFLKLNMNNIGTKLTNMSDIIGY